jgi:alpha-L-arabinofuranosidase
VAVDAFVDGPCIEAPTERLSRWPHRVADLGPFRLVDAAATADRDRRRLALTVVNRGEAEEQVEVTLQGAMFANGAELRCLTGTGRLVPVGAAGGVEEVDLAQVIVEPKGDTLALEVPARSFSLLEANLATN